MANIYYSYSDNRTGVLRAILSSEEGGWLLKAYSAKYAGHQFPSTDHNSEGSFAVVRIFEGEGSDEWRVGFYFLHDDMMRIEEAVHSCNPGGRSRKGPLSEYFPINLYEAVASELLFRLAAGHVTLLHSDLGLARIEVVVADSKGIGAGCILARDRIADISLVGGKTEEGYSPGQLNVPSGRTLRNNASEQSKSMRKHACTIFTKRFRTQCSSAAIILLSFFLQIALRLLRENSG